MFFTIFLIISFLFFFVVDIESFHSETTLNDIYPFEIFYSLFSFSYFSYIFIEHLLIFFISRFCLWCVCLCLFFQFFFFFAISLIQLCLYVSMIVNNNNNNNDSTERRKTNKKEHLFLYRFDHRFQTIMLITIFFFYNFYLFSSHFN